MGIVIRDADLARDKEILIRTLNQNRPRVADERRFRWRYLDNPHGQARAWLAVDDQKEAVVGFTVVHPRLMSVCGEELLCWNCGDFSINKQYRSLGVAIKLRVAATQYVNQEAVPFLYAHPNDRMRIIHLKAGHTIIGQMVRYARVLRVDRYLPEMAKASWFSESLAQAYYRGLVAWQGAARLRTSYHCEISEHFPEKVDFASLQQDVGSRWKVFGIRNRAYLQWRFSANPLYQVSVLQLYQGQALVGYVFYTHADSIMYVLDLFCLPEQDVFHALVIHLTEVGLEQKAQSISMRLLETHPLIPVMQRYGYVQRAETSSVIVHTSSEMQYRGVIQEKANWFMTEGDRDV
jgi:hypothetical protein